MGLISSIKDGFIHAYHKITRVAKKVLGELGKGVEKVSKSVGLPAFIISSGILSLTALVGLPLAPIVGSILGSISTISEGITAAGAFSAAIRSNNYEHAIRILSTTRELQNRFNAEVGNRIKQIISLPIFKTINVVTDRIWEYIKPLKDRVDTVYKLIKCNISNTLKPIIERIKDVDDRIGGHFNTVFRSIQNTITTVLRGQLSPIEQMIAASNLGEQEYRNYMNNRTYAWIMEMERIP